MNTLEELLIFFKINPLQDVWGHPGTLNKLIKICSPVKDFWVHPRTLIQQREIYKKETYSSNVSDT